MRTILFPLVIREIYGVGENKKGPDVHIGTNSAPIRFELETTSRPKKSPEDTIVEMLAVS